MYFQAVPENRKVYFLIKHISRSQKSKKKIVSLFCKLFKYLTFKYLVMLGLFGIQSGTASADHWYSDNDDFEKGWQKIIRRLKWVFGNSKAPRAILLEYNSYNGLGVDMDAGYATSCTEEKNDSQDLQVQYDHIE